MDDTKTPGQITHYMLRTVPPGRDLDQYVFQDRAHAITWLTQGTVEGQQYAQTHYQVALVQMKYGKRPCSHCGHVEAYPQRRRTLSVSQFLHEYRSQNQEDLHA